MTNDATLYTLSAVLDTIDVQGAPIKSIHCIPLQSRQQFKLIM